MIRYNAGLLNDYGGGNVEWWQDYIRGELGRCNDFWEEQLEEKDAELAALKGEANLERLHYQGGGLEMAFSHPMVARLVNECADLLSQTGAPNFLTMNANRAEGEAFEVTIRREGGKTPADKLRDMEKEQAELVALLRKAGNTLCDCVEQYKGNCDMTEAWEDALAAALKRHGGGK